MRNKKWNDDAQSFEALPTRTIKHLPVTTYCPPRTREYLKRFYHCQSDAFSPRFVLIRRQFTRTHVAALGVYKRLGSLQKTRHRVVVNVWRAYAVHKTLPFTPMKRFQQRFSYNFNSLDRVPIADSSFEQIVAGRPTASARRWFQSVDRNCWYTYTAVSIVRSNRVFKTVL